MRLFGIADDLTGALEAGAKLGCPVYFETAIGSGEAAVIDIESRHLSEQQAASAITKLAPECRQAELVYKKTDSTLRGNIGAELHALSNIFHGGAIAYIPAYPAMGRSVRNGNLHVHGVRVENTQFARDIQNPIRSGLIRGLLSPKTDCEIFDGETDRDVTLALQSAVRSGRFRIIAGPGAVAAALATELLISPKTQSLLPRVQSCWIVNGSLHEMSAIQMQHAADIGWCVLAPPVLSESPPKIAADAGAYVAERLTAAPPDALIVFGGDTAFGIVQALGSPVLHPLGELVPGVPASRMEGHSTILITKAGGFGTPDLLRQLQKVLHG